jgi:RNA polymerase sigma factor FliA
MVAPPPQTPPDPDELWRAYRDGRSLEARDALILRWSYLVKGIASKVAATLPPTIELSDLVSDGILGLMEAIERFEPDLNVRFPTFAINRIRGAIFDGLRRLDRVPRSVRGNARRAARVEAEMTATLGRAPTDAEVAAAMGIGEEKLREIRIASMTVAALDETFRTVDGEEVSMLEILADATTSDPGEADEARELRMMLFDAIDRLPDREKLVVVLYHFQGFRLIEIAGVLKVTESRVSQIHSQAIRRLRAFLEEGGR